MSVNILESIRKGISEDISGYHGFILSPKSLAFKQYLISNNKLNSHIFEILLGRVVSMSISIDAYTNGDIDTNIKVLLYWINDIIPINVDKVMYHYTEFYKWRNIIAGNTEQDISKIFIYNGDYPVLNMFRITPDLLAQNDILEITADYRDVQYINNELVSLINEMLDRFK